MSDRINQTQPRDLEDYDEISDSVALSDTYMVLDSPSWERPKRWKMENLMAYIDDLQAQIDAL
jgi:hypothetical protein